MKKFLHSDWLRAVQFFFKTVQKRVNSVQKEVTNQAFRLVNDQRNSKMANQIFCFQINFAANDVETREVLHSTYDLTSTLAALLHRNHLSSNEKTTLQVYFVVFTNYQMNTLFVESKQLYSI